MKTLSRFVVPARPVLLVHSLFSIMIVTAVTVGLMPVREILSTPIVTLLYLLAVLVSATQWGLGAGIIASVCAFLGINYFFLKPYYTLAVHQTQDIIVLFVFLVVAIVSSQLVGRVRSSLAEIQMREHEMSLLYELSGALIGLRGEQSIVQLLADRVYTSFDAQAVRISVQADEPITVVKTSKSNGAFTGSPAPIVSIPLLAGAGSIGQIELWCAQPLSASQHRLLHTFASQGVLALERALLARTETRARILEESDRLKTALLSSVSHELRTPLVTIKAAVTSLRSGEVDWESAARGELLAALEEETDRLNQLVANLLNMSRLEVGALEPQRQWNVLAEIVDMAVERLVVVTRRHHLKVDVPEDLPLVRVDAVLIDQVFANLISNGVKYAPPGSTISINAAQQDDVTLLVQVANEGPPVPPEYLERIFEKFQRVTLAERVPGIGLGLSICKGIVEAHGGRIWAENLPDGFVFKFTLPIARDGAFSPRLYGKLE
jgi:two-component system sensor histidine kinase KdpD